MDRSKPAHGQLGNAAAQAAPEHDLPAEIAARIETLFVQIDSSDHYALLGIARNATRAQVRSAFLRAAPAFHPDRYFGKRLGSLGPKMQAVFIRLTLAHDTLLADEKRAEYDAELPNEASTPPESPRPIANSAKVESAITSSTPPKPVTPSGAVRRESISGAVPSDRARREAFAARLAGRPPSGQARGVVPAPPKMPTIEPPSSPIAPNVSPSPEHAKAAGDALRRRYEEKLAHAKGRHVSVHTQAAQAAAQRGDFEEAARQYHEALTQTSDPRLKAAYDDAIARGKQQAIDVAVAAARNHEMLKSWPEAAGAYAKLFALAPSADVAHRASNAYRRAGLDARKAAHYGEEAVKLDPNKAVYRLTLALVYIDAGLTLRARGELDRAQVLEPTNPLIRDVMAKLGLR